eukprot:9316040-Heterocapsa_arctica.AAC.1
MLLLVREVHTVELELQVRDLPGDHLDPGGIPSARSLVSVFAPAVADAPQQLSARIIGCRSRNVEGTFQSIHQRNLQR